MYKFGFVFSLGNGKTFVNVGKRDNEYYLIGITADMVPVVEYNTGVTRDCMNVDIVMVPGAWFVRKGAKLVRELSEDETKGIIQAAIKLFNDELAASRPRTVNADFHRKAYQRFIDTLGDLRDYKEIYNIDYHFVVYRENVSVFMGKVIDYYLKNCCYSEHTKSRVTYFLKGNDNVNTGKIGQEDDTDPKDKVTYGIYFKNLPAEYIKSVVADLGQHALSCEVTSYEFEKQKTTALP